MFVATASLVDIVAIQYAASARTAKPNAMLSGIINVNHGHDWFVKFLPFFLTALKW